MIQTHISWVFLSGCYAYKLKKPVQFDFLDFSTLALRKHYCEQELRLNRRLAPEIYLAVLPVYQHNNALSLTIPGTIVDYCLKMHRFEQTNLLAEQLEQGSFNPAWMDALAYDIHHFHQQQPSVDIAHFNAQQMLEAHITSNLNVASAHIPEALAQQTWQQLSHYAKQTLTTYAPQLQHRAEYGYIRCCHGDLHLNNITLIHGNPRAFDCIEFNEQFATIDTLNDVAFLIMDCAAHQRLDLGMRFLSRYLEYSNDYQDLALLNLYLFYRATVRGKVACLLAEEIQQPRQKLNEARSYFNLAATYTQNVKPRLFAIGGLSGSGKSHLALLGAGFEQAVVIRSDATRKRIAHNHPALALYSSQMNQHTYQAIIEAGYSALTAGFSVILDAAFLKTEERLQVSMLADQCHIALYFYWLDIATATLRTRISQRQHDGSDISDADETVLQQQLNNYHPPQEIWIHHLTSSDHWPTVQAQT
ncbi:MAG: AAA family ATPase [Mariprofundus sp.]|nr:AAA family ATPase [Mariprofundus sp.]